MKKSTLLNEPGFEERTVSFLTGMGLPARTDLGIFPTIFDDEDDIVLVSARKKMGFGTVIDTFVPGNEDDQIRVYHAILTRAKKKKGRGWVASYKSFWELAKEAFGNERPATGQVIRAESALNKLMFRVLTFKGSFLAHGPDGELVRIKKRMFHLVDELYIFEDATNSIVIHLNNELVDAHKSGPSEKIKLPVITAFKADQFTRVLYLWLMGQFWGRSTLHARTIKRFVKEFGLEKFPSSYKEPKYLRRKLKHSIQRINTVLNEHGEKYFFKVYFEADKVQFKRGTHNKGSVMKMK